MSTLPLYLRRHGFGPGDYGQIVAVNGIMITIFQVPLVACLARFNRATLVVLAAAITGIGFGTTELATLKWHYMATVVVWTFGEMLAAPFGAAIISDLAPARMRARYMGMFSTCFCSANAIGAPLGGWILQEYGGKVLWAATLLMGLTAALLYLTIHSRISSRPRLKLPPIAAGESPPACAHCGGLPLSSNLAECPNCGRQIAQPAPAEGF
jgi:MFS family permease